MKRVAHPIIPLFARALYALLVSLHHSLRLMIPITVYQNSTVEYTENQQAGTSIYREMPALKPRAALAAHGAGRA
jgi:uncharacterized lipoprotein YbaY